MSDALILRLAHLVRLYTDWCVASPNIGQAADMIVEIAHIMEEEGQGVPFDAIDSHFWYCTIPGVIGEVIRGIEDKGSRDVSELKTIVEMLRDHYRDYPDWHQYSTLPGQAPRSEYHGLRDAVEARYFEKQKAGAA